MKKVMAIIISLLILLPLGAIMVFAEEAELVEEQTIVTTTDNETDWLDSIFSNAGPGLYFLAIPAALTAVAPPIGVLTLPVTLPVGAVLWLITDAFYFAFTGLINIVN